MSGPTPPRQRIAAFFDLDGTLLPEPSLERRFFRLLRYRRRIGPRQYLGWLLESLRLAPGGPSAVARQNKMYLRGVRANESNRDAVPGACDRVPLPAFFTAGLDC